jgi:hypothetical protein
MIFFEKGLCRYVMDANNSFLIFSFESNPACLGLEHDASVFDRADVGHAVDAAAFV